MIEELEDSPDDGRPWYAVDRPVPPRPSLRRTIEVSLSGGASFGLYEWSGGHKSWLMACVEGLGFAAFLVTLPLLARIQQVRRGRH